MYETIGKPSKCVSGWWSVLIFLFVLVSTRSNVKIKMSTILIRVAKTMVIKSIAVKIHVEHAFKCRIKPVATTSTSWAATKFSRITTSATAVTVYIVRLTLYAPPIQLGFYLLTSSEKIHWSSSLRLMCRMCLFTCCCSLASLRNTLSHLDSTLQP